ncbi:hypothetical protein J8281_17800 [Aquimarina sp. U1-2]|uniref:hypothetical protein n=1 Tax=Aquimarina sp. U1-2 TaxID=2823141 RepID=UPI001AED0803|nr:hypothetical protein [Aquimarina sp. U1-2]MBP2834055.1 hypothetical protein [Aquimarina sp. U1-2]
MMKKSSIPIIYVLVLCMLFSCAEDSGENTNENLPVTRQTLLVGKIWVLAAQTITPARARVANGPVITDWYADMLPCERDAQKIYFFNGDLVFDEGATRCEDTDVQTFAGSWTFNADETIITELQQNFINIIRSYKIIELTENTLVIERQDNFFGLVTHTIVERYVNEG